MFIFLAGVSLDNACAGRALSNQCCQVQVDKLLTHSVLNLAAGYYTHRRTYTEIGLQVI